MKISSFDPLFEYPDYNQTGTSAKANAAAKSVTDPGAKPSAQSSASPNTSGAKPEVQEPKQPTVAKASELKKDFEFPDEKGNVLKVVSPAGEKTDLPNDMEDIVIAQDARKNIRVFDADADIALPQVNVEESADLGNIFDRKKNLARKLARKGNKLKQLIRAAKFGNDYKEPVFELDFNRKEIIDNALDAPIQCGFEAETTWPNFSSGVEGFDWDYADWDNVEDAAFDQGYSRELSRMKNAYNDWLSELAMDYEGEVVQRMVDQRKEDEVYLDDFVSSELDSSDIEEYKEELLDDLRELAKQGRMFQGGQDPQAELDEREDWDDDAWGREYAEEYEMDNFEVWLAEQIRDEGEAWEEAFEEAKELNDMDSWVGEEYGGDWASACSDFDIYMEDENHNNLDEVEESLSSWASAYSKTDDIRQGSYHSGKSVDNKYWRVEDDSSIEGDGSKAEIISPVYDTPREMLTEMKSLFEHFEEEGVETNSTTGLHVTMSFAGDFKETNPLVLATLLGDQYVLKQFDRQFNSYAKSQQQNIQYEIERMLKDGGSPEDFDELYGILSRGIDRGKFSSINFKNATNSDNNQLIEFRIAGGGNYHGNYDKAAKAVIRYAASMSAASEDKPYDRKDFLKTIYRMVNKGASNSLAPTRNDVDISLPDNDFVQAVREILNQTGNRLDAVETLDRAYKELAAGDGVAAKEHFAEFMKSLLVNVRNREKDGGGFKLRPTSLLVRGFKQAMKEFGVNREDIIRAVSQHFVNNADYIVNTTDLDIHDDFIVPTVSILDQILLKKNQPSPQRGPSLGIPHVQDARVYLRRSAYAGQDQYDSGAPVDIDNDVKFVNNDDHFEIDKLISARNVLTSDTLQNNPDPEVKADAQQKLAKVDAELAKFEKIYNVKFANQYPQAGQEMDAFRHANSTDPVWMRHLRSKGIHLYTAESKTFDRFDKLSLQEQLALLGKVDKRKIDEAYNSYKPYGRRRGIDAPMRRKFKQDELEYELRNEPSNNYAVFINGRKWKVVADRQRAERMAQTLIRKGKDAKVHITGEPVSEARKKMSAQERMWRRYNNKKINGKTADERAKELEQKIAQMKKARDAHIANEAEEPKDASARAKLDHSLRAQGHKVEKPKKGKGSFKRKPKHKGKLPEADQVKAKERKPKTVKPNTGHQSKHPYRGRLVGEGAVPETDFVQEYKQIMSRPLLGSDLKGQMRAFELVPDPAMIREFRNQISQAGRDTDLRTVFKSFASGKLHPVQKKQVGLTESRGVTARDPGEQYISDTDPNDILTINSITVFPPEGDAYESLEELDTALGEALAGEQVVNDNMPNRGTLAAVVATVTDAEGNPQHWIRYLRQIPSAGVHGTWKTLRGYKYSKGAQQESLPLKPTDVLAVDRFMSAEELSKNIVDTVTTNFKGTPNEALIGVMDEAVQKARANDTSPITGAAPYINVLVKYGGEYLGPLALIDGGNTEGDTGKMLESYGLSTLKGSQVLFPGDTAFELVDSLIKTPDGQRIGVSSKAHKGGGAASSLSGIVKQITPEMELQYPEASAIVRALGTQSAIEGPLKVAVMLDLLTETDAEAIRAVGKASKDPGDIKSVKVQQMVAAQGLDDENNPSYRVLFHALAAVVNTLIPMVNAREDFAALLKAALNNNNFIQLMTNGKQTGNDVALNYYTKYPAVFEGAPKLYNKSYFATGQKGRLGFKLKK